MPTPMEELLKSDRLIYHAVRGSQVYGTALPTSDTDTHGLFRIPRDEWFTLFPPVSKISDEKEDNVFYELRRYMELALTANPTVLEMLWTPKEYILVDSVVMKILRENRNLFITMKCFHSFTGYAYAQIKKAKGKNKKVMRTGDYGDDTGINLLRYLIGKGTISPEWIESRFCGALKDYILRDGTPVLTDKTDWTEMDVHADDNVFRRDADENVVLRGPHRMSFVRLINVPGWSTLGFQSEMPMRPWPLRNGKIDLKECHVAALEHVPNTYRLYHYGPSAKGVFRDGQLICENIPIEDESVRFIGLLVFNQHEYEQARNEYKSYWEWMANRNDARWVDQEKGNLDFDQKNMCHTVRLMLSGENILRKGEPIIRFQGPMLEFLRDIRTGKYAYEFLMKFVEEKEIELRELYDSGKCTLPHGPNTKRINELYKELAVIPL